MRGNLLLTLAKNPKHRSIPACTGEPHSRIHAETVPWVYPRVYGGTGPWIWAVTTRSGLSPRVRGNPLCTGWIQNPSRSIPACTGEPPFSSSRARRERVYPRVYGGTFRLPTGPARCQGLSPRVRGNRWSLAGALLDEGSIPACTGEPSLLSTINGLLPVYPRVYGGTGRMSLRLSNASGLSPRVRGNRLHRIPSRRGSRSIPACTHGLRYCGDGHQRSIPACTGEPPATDGGCSAPRVYPRVYGGTIIEVLVAGASDGLSPRVRGNQPHPDRRLARRRSIPACTGEPARQLLSPSATLRGSIPACTGEPHSFSRQVQDSYGLSPRVRGNPTDVHALYHVGRSIPACTGEPITHTSSNHQGQVYPRVYGGTSLPGAQGIPGVGLSPRVRGNLPRRRHDQRSHRSIPACTGEPAGESSPSVRYGVYPRVYGGTAHPLEDQPDRSGLSPRVRGKTRLPDISRQGSIPACTGEPDGVRVQAGSSPRVRSR